MTTISWPEVAQRLAPARNYWLATVSTAAAPHTVPVWGVVVADVFSFYTERRTRKARNLARNPSVLIHLESAEDVVIVHGTAIDLGRPEAVPAIVSALAEKYQEPGDAAYLPFPGSSFDVVYALQPALALTWRLAEYETSQRRWSAD